MKNAVINLPKKLGVDINMKDIAVAHRIGNRKNKDAEEKRVPNVIDRFVHEEKKQQLMSASKEKKLRNIYCNDHLSQYTWEILRAARQYRKNEEVKFVWVQDGKVLIRENERSGAIRIWSCSHLE